MKNNSMKTVSKIAWLAGAILSLGNVNAQIVRDYDPSIQRTTNMQYFKPAESHLFAGDCMPLYHEGTFYLYWLLDEGHHSGLGGLGGHQWALSTTTDLVHWQHYPVAVGIDEEWEKSICTGSILVEKDKFYAFYSTRVRENEVTAEQLSYAISTDGGRRFEKQLPNPFYFPPEECYPWDFRDPKIFKGEDGRFHMFISGYRKDAVMSGYGGYLVHLISGDLQNWTETTPVLEGQRATPECADYFKWNDWYYLIYSTHSETQYLKSRHPFGPWEYPSSQVLWEEWANVYKTAEFHNGRRIAVAFIPGKWNNKDDDGEVFGGNILLRELVQEKDGTLKTRFLPEVLPTMKPISLPQITVSAENGTVTANKEIKLLASGRTSVASVSGLPQDYRLTFEVATTGNYDELGVFLRATDREKKGYKMGLNLNNRQVRLNHTAIHAVDGLDTTVQVDIIVKDDIFDVCINNERCIVNRLPEQKGDNLFFFVKNGEAVFQNIRLQEIKE
ncbi:MAG: family 43 glycosylhydrolase [Tannerellaceae bacterium]|nr:family 43 glycosylhydrolase [Tannerellaceae bacterium]